MKLYFQCLKEESQDLYYKQKKKKVLENNMEKEIRKVLEKLIKETPNDTDLGKKIRRLYIENKIRKHIKNEN
jgi:hemerythrin-like domain-containing protein